MIHTDQSGFVQNRFLGNNVLDVYSLIAIAEESEDNDCALLALDVEKAFDSLDWNFLRTTLWGFGFPEEFLNMVTLMQQNAYVQIMNNGYLSDGIKLQRGLPQGCGLSPYLFILAVEGLANTLRADDTILGISTGPVTKKVAQVADDSLLSFKGSVTVINHVRTVLDHFSQVLGLKMNYEKSTLIALGRTMPPWFKEDCVSDFRKLHISEGFKYLGVNVSNNKQKLIANYHLDATIVKTTMDSRPHKNTSISGCILQVKLLMASQFVYPFQLLPTPKVCQLHTVTSAFNNFVWDFQCHCLDKHVLCHPRSQGGLGMVNIVIQNMSLKFVWLNRLLSESVNCQFWGMYLFHSFIIPFHEALDCNIHPDNFMWLCKPSTSLPWFWKDVFTKWYRHFYVSKDCTSVADQ